MRIRSVWISQYKNLHDFSIDFPGDGFIDIFVGKNGSGKSNFLEALIEILDHVYLRRRRENLPNFDYEIRYEIEDAEVQVSWRAGELSVNGSKGRRTLGQTRRPDHLLVYYSGQNEQVSRLVRRYEESFRDELRNATDSVAPDIIGIGPACKKLLVVTMLLLPEKNVARQILCGKLGVLSCSRTITLEIAPPYFFNGSNHDPLDAGQFFWGVEGYAKTFIQALLDSLQVLLDSTDSRDGGYSLGQLYDREAGIYRLECSVDRLRDALGDESGVTLFRSLDALRVLGMLKDIQLRFAQKDLEISTLDLFSDGQFQSVYLFAVAELFKHLNCVTLLDEPDAFLHPEWQFEFLQQVSEISEQAARTNHFLLTSHSASTVAGKSGGRLRLFAMGTDGVEAVEHQKSDLIRSLSAGFITFSEQEATLSINQIVLQSNGPILFTEGLSDAIILRTAWEKLNPGAECAFGIEHGFGSAFLSHLFRTQHLFEAHPGRTFFALFDFDEAYQDWIQLGADVETDPTRCLAKKKRDQEAYALLLPVPAGLSIRGQVLKPDGVGHFANKSRLSIELMFRDVAALADRFEADPGERDGCIRFLGEKVPFARDIVPNLRAEAFEGFRPIFDFVHAKTARP